MNLDRKLQAELRLGRVLRRRWTLERVIGAGGTATVYAGTHRNGSRVAIKVLHPWLHADPVTLQRFLREGYIANSIGVPDVVKVIDDDVEDDIAYLVMELLEGSSIEVLRERGGGRLPPADVTEIGCRLLRVLEAAHVRGVLHRDIKPANLFRTVDPAGFKVLDFGIAHINGALGSGEDTSQGMCVGTPAYMAPEQARGGRSELDERTDLWSVGATLFTLLTGEYVHSGRNAGEILAAAREYAVGALEQRLYGVPPELAAVVERAIAVEPASRYASAADMRAACEQCRQSLAERGERSRLFAASERVSVSTAPRRAPVGERPSMSALVGAFGRIVPPTNPEPRAGYWSGRVGRLWWFYYTGPCTDETWLRYLAMVKAMLDTGKPCSLACFAHHAEGPSALQRKQMAEFIDKNRIELERLDRFALIIDSIVHRGAITAINWLVRKPFEERIFNAPISAIKWLTVKQAEPTPAAVKAAIVSQVPKQSLWSTLSTDAADTLEISASM